MTDLTEIHIEEPFGPVYPDLGASVAKLRRRFTDGLASAPKQMRNEYGDAVLKAILSKQRSELQRVVASHSVSCASGLHHSEGKAILKALQAKHRAALQACARQERAARTPDTWREMYAAAMEEKRSRPAPCVETRQVEDIFA